MARHLVAVLLIVLGLGSAGCPSSHGPAGGQAFRTGGADSLIHEQSRIVFPARVGDFVREGTRTYAADGSNVSAGYNYVGPDGAIAATSYVYPSPKLVSIGSPQHVIDTARAKLSNEEFARCKQDIVQEHPQAALVSEGTVAATNGRSALMAEYEFTILFAGSVQRVKSRLYLLTYINGSWTLKHRITFPAARPLQSKVDQYVRDFGSATSPTPAERTPAEPAAAPPPHSPGFPPPAVVAHGRYPEAFALIRAQVPQQLPQLGEADRAVVNSSDPVMTGWYKMSGDYGQYFFEWKLPGGSRVVANYTGGLHTPRAGSIDVRLSVQP